MNTNQNLSLPPAEVEAFVGRFRKQNWRQGLESLDRLRVTFAKEGIPLEFLSHYKPYEPFAFLRINDGLSDKFWRSKLSGTHCP
ncbi:hypothetical protein SAMN05216317_1483 [Nitrosomonas eutropha]|nr:hypothetical protein [Nitrosomonas sp. GH22]MXS81008.1 hypothetical protein [Nitrosomonas sp. GH22]SDX16153.1 hypothetical protein SAMN05216317_1483 [Nitrosomonas eutropha]